MLMSVRSGDSKWNSKVGFLAVLKEMKPKVVHLFLLLIFQELVYDIFFYEPKNIWSASEASWIADNFERTAEANAPQDRLQLLKELVDEHKIEKYLTENFPLLSAKLR